jgi:hypothetical protein
MDALRCCCEKEIQGAGHEDKSECNKGGFCMHIWRRWQKVAPVVIGALLLLTPLVFGLATIGSPSLWAWILGAVVAVGAVALALLWLGYPRNRVIEGMVVPLGLVLLISPVLLGLTAAALTACIMGAVLLTATAGVLMESQSRQATVPAYRPVYLDTRTYRRVNSPL